MYSPSPQIVFGIFGKSLDGWGIGCGMQTMKETNKLGIKQLTFAGSFARLDFIKMKMVVRKGSHLPLRPAGWKWRS